jgi:hypothetical protein
MEFSNYREGVIDVEVDGGLERAVPLCSARLTAEQGGRPGVEAFLFALAGTAAEGDYDYLLEELA